MPPEPFAAPFDHDPADLTPDDRRRAVAAILAAGVLRLRDRHALPPDPAPENLKESRANGLASRPTVGVTVHGG